MLTIQDLQVVYPNGYEALKSVSLEAQPGEIVALIGRSGAGKSTILRCVNGIQPITSGQIVLNGTDIGNLHGADLQHMRRKIGFIWQEHNLVERLSVIKNVLTGRLGYSSGVSTFFHYFNGEHRRIAVDCLDRVNMIHRATQRADRLSGGEKQRVAIARAIAQEPMILLADEPVASLDIELSWQVMNDFVQVARSEGVPTLISIHDVELAKAFCDRIVGLAQGHIVFNGPPMKLDKPSLDAIYRFDRPVSLPQVQDEYVAASAYGGM